MFQIMAWRRPGGKPLSEPAVVSLLTHTCVTTPQRVKGASGHNNGLGKKGPIYYHGLALIPYKELHL